MPFQDSSTGGGYYEAQPGMLKGKFLGTEDGPELEFTEKDGTKKATKNMRWKWELSGMDGAPVMYVAKGADGQPGTDAPQRAIADALSTEATGPKAKARKWLEAHEGGTKIDGAISGAEFAARLDACVQKGAEVYLVFGPNEKGKITVQNVIAIQAAA